MTEAQKFASSTPRFISIKQIRQDEQKKQQNAAAASSSLAGFNNKLSLALGGLDADVDEDGVSKKSGRGYNGSGRKRTFVTVGDTTAGSSGAVKKEKTSGTDNNNNSGLRKKDEDVKDKLSQLSQSLSQALSKNKAGGGAGKKTVSKAKEEGVKPKTSTLPQGL
jgi:hypothetical protein